MIKKASFEDLPALINLAKRFHNIGPYRAYEFNPELVSDYLTAFFNRADARIYMTATGAIGMSIERSDIYFKPLVKERFFYAEKGDGKGLLGMLDHFADQNGGLPIILSAISRDGKDTRVHTRLFGREGYRVAETLYVKGDI